MLRLLLASAVLCVSSARATEGDKPKADAEVEKAKTVYKTKCAACHGKDAKGSPAMAKMFKAPPAALDLMDEESLGKKDDELSSIILKGRGKMPAFGGLKNDIEAVVRYLRGLAPLDKAKKASGAGS